MSYISLEPKPIDGGVGQPFVLQNSTIIRIRRNAEVVLRLLIRLWTRYKHLKVRAGIFCFWLLCVLYIITSVQTIRGNFIYVVNILYWDFKLNNNRYCLFQSEMGINVSRNRNFSSTSTNVSRSAKEPSQ